MSDTPHLNYNGTLLRADKAIIGADNRSFRYGDGLFETMKMVNGCIPLADLHFDRLMNGIELLQLDKPSYLTGEYLSKQIADLAKKNNHHQRVRVRLTVFRGDGGLYDPKNHFTNYVIQTWDMPDDFTGLNENGLSIDIFPDAIISCDKFANLKSNNYLPYLMGALYVKKNQLNDCLLLNANGNICDSTIANVFIIKDGIIVTPPLTEGCIAGVMRKYLLEKLPQYDFQVSERCLSVADLMEAEEVFLSNAVHGIKWVRQFRNAQFSRKETLRIFHTIVQNVC